MIIDYFKHVAQYQGVIPHFAQYIAFAETAQNLPAGRYELANGDFAVIYEGSTQPQQDGLFETHQQYADLQYVVSGSEWIEWQAPEQLVEVRPYESEADIAQYQGVGAVVRVDEGMFYFVLPQDAHKPGVHVTTAFDYRKIIFKIKLHQS